MSRISKLGLSYHSREDNLLRKISDKEQRLLQKWMDNNEPTLRSGD